VRHAGAAFCSFAELIPRLRKFPKFELRLGAHAQRVTWNAHLGLADGVEYIDRATRSTQHIRAAAVIVAAGPLASPKLLMQSTSPDFPTGMGDSHGVLGRFLHDHPKDWCILELDRPMPRIDQPLHVTRAPYAESPPLMGATMTIGPLSKWDRLLSFTGATDRRFGLVTFATMIPEQHNQLRLHPQRNDQFGMPVLDIDIRYGAEITQTITRAHERFGGILAAAGIRANFNCPLDKLAPGSAAHYGGSARMHASPQHGVVDGWNRLHDARNVAVVDASSFTTGVEKNPTLTAMALAARTADSIARDILTSPSISSQRASCAVPSLRQH
jgi:choline dehydrogenase-like flavoprotein